MKKVLTPESVSYLWEKIQAKFVTVTALNNVESKIPTESTIKTWGFTKNTGTYSKPSDGIPETDFNADVKTKLNKDATVKELNKGYKQEFWVGTKAEYESLSNTSPTCLYIITDDVDGNNSVSTRVIASTQPPTDSEGNNGDLWVVYE